MHHRGGYKNAQNLVLSSFESWLDMLIDNCNTQRRGQVPWKQNERVPWTFRGLCEQQLFTSDPSLQSAKCRERPLPSVLFPGLPGHPALCALFGLALWSYSLCLAPGVWTTNPSVRVLSSQARRIWGPSAVSFSAIWLVWSNGFFLRMWRALDLDSQMWVKSTTLKSSGKSHPGEEHCFWSQAL